MTTTDAPPAIKPGDTVHGFGFFVAGLCVGYGAAYEFIPLVMFGVGLEVLLIAWPYSSFARHTAEAADGR